MGFSSQELAGACAIALVLVLVFVLAGGHHHHHHHARETFCDAPPAPGALSEASALSRLGAVPSAASGGGCAAQNPEAEADRAGLRLLGWRAAPPDDDLFAQHRLARGKSSTSGVPPSSNSRLRMETMRENFGGPPSSGYGWAPTPADIEQSVDKTGWHDRQSSQTAACVAASGCADSRCRLDCAEKSLARAAGLQH